MPDALLDVGHHSDDDPNQDFRRRIEKSGDSGEALPREQMCKKIMDAGLRRPLRNIRENQRAQMFIFVWNSEELSVNKITPELRLWSTVLFIYYQSLLLWSIPGLMAIARQRMSVRACMSVQDLSPYA